MFWGNMDLLVRISSFLQISSIILVFVSGSFQLARYAIDRRLSFLKDQVQRQKDNESQQIINGLRQSSDFSNQLTKIRELEVASLNDSRLAFESLQKLAVISDENLKKL